MVWGSIGTVAIAAPFAMSLWPSERAKAAGAPVDVDISKLEPGQKINVEWRGKVVWVINRTPAMLASLPKLDNRVADPKSEVDQQPKYCQERGPFDQAGDLRRGRDLHASRLLADVPAARSRRRISGPTGWAASSVRAINPSSISRAASTRASRRRANLEIPPYKFLSDTSIRIGEDKDSKAA